MPILQLDRDRAEEAACHLDLSKLLQAGTKTFFNNPALSDLTLVCPDGRALHCHSIILASASRRFAAAFKQGSWAPGQQMPVKGVDSDALETLICAFYTAECPLELPRVPALYDAAVKLEVPSLAPALEQYLGGALQPHNCCHTLELCIGAGATPLADLVLEWIRNRVTDVVPHAEFWSCRLETAAIICKDLSHVSQLLALQAAVAWLSALASRNNLLGVFSEASGLSPEAIQAVAASGATLGGPLGLVGSGGGNDRLGGPGLGLRGLGNSGISLKLQSGPGGLGPDGLAGGPSSGPGPILQLLPNSNNAGAMLVSPLGGGGGGLGPGVGLGGGGGGLQVDPSLGPGMGLGSLLSKGGGGGGAGFGLDALADAAEGERVQKRLRPGAGAGGGGGGGGGGGFGDRSGSATPMHSGDLSADGPLQLGGGLAALRGPPPRDLDGQPLGGPMGHVSMGGGGNHHAHPTGSGGRPRSKPSSGSGGAGGGGGSGGRAGGGGGRRKRGASDDDDEDYAPVGGRGGGGGRGSRAQEMVYDADAVLTDEQAGGSGPGDDHDQGGGGGDGDGEGGSGGAPGSTPVLMTGRRAPAQKGQCHVQGCNRSLLGLRDYYQRYKICEHHLKVSSVLKDGVPHRFCQQCGRFHPLSEFDGDRRSCRTMLQRHCHRRAKQKQELAEVLAQRYEEKQVAASLSAVVSALTRGGGADLPPAMLGLPLLAGLAPGAGGGGGALDDLSLALGGGGGGGSNGGGGGGKGRRSGLPPGLHSPPSKAQLLEAVQRARKQHANLAQQQLMELAGDAPLAAAVAAAVATGGGGLDDVGGGGSRGGGGDGRLGGLDDLVGRGGGGGGSHDGSGDDGGGGDRGGGGGGRVLDVKPEPLQGSDGGGGGSDGGGGDGGGADRPGA